MDGRDGEMMGDVQYQTVSMMIHERLAESEAARRGAVAGRAERDWSTLAALQRRLYGARVDVASPPPRRAGLAR
jgi:hypothetical protein